MNDMGTSMPFMGTSEHVYGDFRARLWGLSGTFMGDSKYGGTSTFPVFMRVCGVFSLSAFTVMRCFNHGYALFQ